MWEGIPLQLSRVNSEEHSCHPLLLASQRLLLFSGKGGVGKTTLTCALARQLAQVDPQRRLLLMSTDPAHSLGDVLQISVTDVAQPLPDRPNLQVRALQAEILLQSFRQTYGPALELIAERGSWFGREDLLPIWDLAWPGVDELMAILEVNRLLAREEVDTVILDTAPTGHTLRLLELPDFLDNLLAVFATFQAKHREIAQALTGTYRPDEADAFLAQLQGELEGGKARLTNPESTSAWLVMIPEQLSVAETRRFCQQLQSRRVPIGGLLVNQVLFLGENTSQSSLPTALPSSLYLARQQEQGRVLKALQEELPGYPIWICPYQLQEPVGLAALDELVQQLRPLPEVLLELEGIPEQKAESQEKRKSLFSTLFPSFKGIPSLPDFLTQGIRLVLVGGKGGVGKTTVAGALAWNLAKRHPDKQLLLVSINLQLTYIFQLSLCPAVGNRGTAQNSQQALLPLLQFFWVESVFQTVEGDAVEDGGKMLCRFFSHPLSRAIGGDQFRVSPLQLLQLAVEAVVNAVFQDGRIVDIVGNAGLLQQGAQLAGAFFQMGIHNSLGEQGLPLG